MLHAVEPDEALVDGVTEILGGFLPDDSHHAGGQFAVELVVGREDGDLLVGELLLQLEVREACLDAEFLGLVGAGDDAAVVVGEDDDGFAVEVGPEDPLAGHVAVVAVDDAVHRAISSSYGWSKAPRPTPRNCRCR